jgi:hypothetical protein
MTPATITPRERFLQSNTRISDHKAMVESAVFVTATEAAMLEFIQGMTRGVANTQDACALGYEIVGAQNFLNCLRQLTDNETPPKRAVPGNLNPKA